MCTIGLEGQAPSVRFKYPRTFPLYNSRLSSDTMTGENSDPFDDEAIEEMALSLIHISEPTRSYAIGGDRRGGKKK